MEKETAVPEENSSRKWLALVGLGLGVFMATLDTSIVNIALPTLADQLHASFATVQWVVLSYVLVLTSLMLSIARLGDMFNKKKIYLAGLGLFTLGSLLCGMAPNAGALIGFRALQGLGGTMMQALGMAMVTEVFPPSERGRAVGLIGSIVSVGIAVGPPLGGLLIGLAGWRVIFLVNVPVGVITALAVLRYVPSSTARPGQRFDPAGSLILLVTLALYALGMTLGQTDGFSNPLTLTLLAGAALGLVLLLYVEARVGQPMIDLSLFQNSLFSLNLLMGFLVFIVLSVAFVLPFFLEIVGGFSTEQVGIMLMTMPVCMGLTSPISGMLSDRFDPHTINFIGLLVIIGGCLAMSTMPSHLSLFSYALRIAPIGLGMGIFQSPNNSIIMGAVPRQRLGIASGLLSLSRTLGQSTGLPLMGVLFTNQVLSLAHLSFGADITKAPAFALAGGVQGVYRVSALIVAGAAVLAVAAYRMETGRPRSSELPLK